jgi:hypothetical protein
VDGGGRGVLFSLARFAFDQAVRRFYRSRGSDDDKVLKILGLSSLLAWEDLKIGCMVLAESLRALPVVANPVTVDHEDEDDRCKRSVKQEISLVTLGQCCSAA